MGAKEKVRRKRFGRGVVRRKVTLLFFGYVFSGVFKVGPEPGSS
jgi:hypothetical protein